MHTLQNPCATVLRVWTPAVASLGHLSFPLPISIFYSPPIPVLEQTKTQLYVLGFQFEASVAVTYRFDLSQF